MSRRLWDVLADQRPVAVVAADADSTAWEIVAALAEIGDVPDGGRGAAVTPCQAKRAEETLALADSLGVGDRFLACLSGGMFLTSIGGMTLTPGSCLMA